MRKLTFSLIIGLLMICQNAEAGKKTAPAGPSAEEQQQFTNDFWKAAEAGGQALHDFEQNVVNHGTDAQSQMLSNLEHGKAADGSEAKGFHGDPTDKGPSDWSDYDIQTDKDGNITGFKEKDFDQIDKDKDGKVSKEERDAWMKKKQEEWKKNGGPPGHVHKNPDWDKDGDGKPDPGFSLDCFRCYRSPMNAFKKQDGGVTETIPVQDNCSNHGFFDDGNCEGKCTNGECVPVDVDVSTNTILKSDATREKGTKTMSCFACKEQVTRTTVEVTYYVLIIETPYERFILNQNGSGGGFKPTSVMALAKVDPSTGKIPNIQGDLKNITDFMGGFNVGFGPGGLSTTGKVSMDQLSSLLNKNLSGGGNFGANCFDNVQNDADKDAMASGTPTGQQISEGKLSKQDNSKSDKAISEDQNKKSEDAGTPAVSGPVIACGNQNGNKVLQIYSAGGELVDTITQTMLKANPNVILEKLGIAQSFTDKLMLKTNIDFAGYVEKFTGIPLKQIQSYAAQVQDIKSKADAVLARKQKGKKQEPVVPNDALYQSPEKPKKSFFGGDNQVGPVTGNLPVGMYIADVAPKPKAQTPDQYSLRKIGYTPLSDPNSAWNVIDMTQKNVVVAIVDSGLDMSHPDGPQYIWTNPKEIADNHIDDDQDGFADDVHGWNFLDENNDLTDYKGHGTFVAGIIAAKWNNGIGIAGINPGAVIMPIKVADDEGQTNSLDIYRGINFAVNHGAKIINVSLGGRLISKLEQQAIDRAYAMGAIVVVAAGNNNDNLMVFGPASSRHALSVGMLDSNDERSNVSNWGPNLALVAPGENIYSLVSKDTKKILPSLKKAGYFTQSGTSFTAPMVAATASLIWAKNPDLTNQQVIDIILSTAKSKDGQQWNGMTGSGMLDAAAALRATSDEKLIVMVTNMHINRDMANNLTSVDVYGTVRGKFKEFTIEAGKGKLAHSFNKVAGPFQTQYSYQFIARLNIHDVLRGSKDWVLRIKVIDNNGQEHTASEPFSLPDK